MKFSNFVEITGSLPYLLEPITKLCPELNESYLFTTHFNVVTWLDACIIDGRGIEYSDAQQGTLY
jgi:hypothetical protein